jgi:glycosyltransferase involved in cell wall biosynthesis
VGVDAGALWFPAGGVRRYAFELFSRVAALAPDIEFVAVDRAPGDPLPPGVTDGSRAVALPSNLGRAVALGWTIRGARLNLFHAPAYTAPFTSVPVVLTIHDVSYARRPEFYAHQSGPLRQWFYRRSAARAAHIITDSAFSRSEITAAYGVPESRISVVPLGVGLPFSPAGGQVSATLPPGVRPPFVLHVGDLHRRRDLPTALRAVCEANEHRTTGRVPLQLVAVGTDAGAAAPLRQLSRDMRADDTLIQPGAVDEAMLLSLYRSAVAFVYPSLYEGFGLPVLEAMACGLPVVAAQAGSVPEVVGDAGILAAPGDVRAFAEAVRAIANHPDRRKDLAARGLARAAAFTWDRTARETVAVYRRCLQ